MGGVGVGVFKDIKDGVEQMVRVDRNLNQILKTLRYMRNYIAYIAVFMKGLRRKKYSPGFQSCKVNTDKQKFFKLHLIVLVIKRAGKLPALLIQFPFQLFSGLA